MQRLFKYLKNILFPVPALHVAIDIGDKRNKTIVLLHGIAATSKTWDLLVAELGSSKYHIVGLDLLGFGQSPKPTDYDYNVGDHVALVHKTLKKLKIRRPFVIVGHSMGAIISAHYYTKYPSDIKEMFILSPPLYLDDDSQTIIARKRTDLYLDAYKFLAEKKDFTISNSQLIRKILLVKDGIDVNQDNWDGFRLSLMNTIIKQNTFKELCGVKIPVQIVYGSLDQLLIQESVNKLAVYKNIEISKLSGVDHTIGKRFAVEVARMINNK